MLQTTMNSLPIKKSVFENRSNYTFIQLDKWYPKNNCCSGVSGFGVQTHPDIPKVWQSRTGLQIEL